MSLLALLFLLQAAAPTPTPTPPPSTTPSPAPKRTPVVAGGFGSGRTLSDVARERRLVKEKGTAAAKGGTLTVAPSGGGIGAKDAPAAPPDAAGKTSGLDPRRLVVVESAENNGVVGSNGMVRVYGQVKNAGDAPACDVSITVRLYDEKGVYLVSGGGKIDEPLLRPAMSSSYSVWVQAPPGVGGMPKEKVLGYGTTGPGGTLEGKWRGLGRAEAEIVSVGDSCPGEKPEEKPAGRPEEKPTALPR
jgi:hypothetical protein